MADTIDGRWSNGDPVHLIVDGEGGRLVAPNLNGATWIEPDEYTPTDADIRRIYAQHYAATVEYHEKGFAEFDRWLAAHDAKVRQELLKDLAERIHKAWVWQYDDCDHGTYHGGPSNGEPYKMCEIFAENLYSKEEING